MSQVILKWNPAISSYTMERYLMELRMLNEGYGVPFNWSVHDHDKIHKNDRYYLLKLGYGQQGIVSTGTITSEPYRDEDWSGKGRETYYVNLRPDMMLNPDAMPILTSEELTRNVKGEFNWYKGHSGIVLTTEEAEEVGFLWMDLCTKANGIVEKALSATTHDKVFVRK